MTNGICFLEVKDKVELAHLGGSISSENFTIPYMVRNETNEEADHKEGQKGPLTFPK
jgi:hypothetical protein